MKTPGHWGRLVRSLREKHGIGTQKLALLSGVHRSSIRRAEDGNNVSIDNLDKLLRVFGYELDALKK